MNPSASGWINKLIFELQKSQFLNLDLNDFYAALKTSGFIYGSNVSTICNTVDAVDFNEEECCKINLLSAFYYIHKKKANSDDFITSVIEFYKAVDQHKRFFFLDFLGEPKPDRFLEKTIHKRIHIDDNFITKNFNYFLINALLFIDVIGYHYFLINKTDIKDYLNIYEANLETIVFKVLDSKVNKTEYDEKLVKLFEASLRYKNHHLSSDVFVKNTITEPLEKCYIIDTVCMASWSDAYIDAEEFSYLNQLRQDLKIDKETLANSINDINTFYIANKDQIAFLSSKNLAQSFYNNSSSFVKRVIKRNSKRLVKELKQSKEAITLLAKSTHTTLTYEEQRKIQNQLIDIFKSIPSLAIFILPGGGVLLPLFVKFIPKLLPSAFDDNRIDDELQDYRI